MLANNWLNILAATLCAASAIFQIRNESPAWGIVLTLALGAANVASVLVPRT